MLILLCVGSSESEPNHLCHSNSRSLLDVLVSPLVRSLLIGFEDSGCNNHLPVFSIFPLHWDDLLHYFIHSSLVIVSSPEFLDPLLKRCYKSFVWFAEVAALNSTFFFCFLHIFLSKCYWWILLTCDNAYLKCIAALKIPANAFLLIRIKYSCSLVTLPFSHPYPVSTAPAWWFPMFPPQEKTKKLQVCGTGWENKLCVVTCFVRGRFVPSHTWPVLVGRCFDL